MNFTEIYNWLLNNSVEVIRVFMIIGIGIPLVFFIRIVITRALKKQVSPQVLMLITKVITYTGSVIIFVMTMREMGFKLTALLGAAGIAGVAIGFASQTSLSNLISGIFLIWEKPFQLGDLIKVDNHLGLIESINPLSINLRTFDNQLIRIPNESLIKTSFTNVTRFPIRRMDLNIGVAYKENIDEVIEILKDVADKNRYCLDEPEPIVIFKGFGDSALEFLFGPWFAKEDYINLRNTILPEIKKRFDKEGIEIPFPHRTLYTGAVTDPFPIKIVPGNDSDERIHIPENQLQKSTEQKSE